MEDAQAPLSFVHFGAFELLPDSGELRKLGVRVRLSGQAFDLLVLLIAARGRIVSREELQAKLWPGSSFGDFDHGLNAAVNRLREALGDSAAVPTYVETVPRRGYRFIAPLNDQSPGAGLLPGITPVIPKPVPAQVNASHGQARVSARLPVLTLLITLAVGGIATWFGLRHREATPDVSGLTEAPFTSLPGSEISPSFSPDGSQIAFEWDGENHGAGYDLYVQAIGAENPHRLTHQPSPSWVATAWSPDGRFIAIRTEGATNPHIDLIPATGGPARRIANLEGETFQTGLLAWSPDAKTLASIEHIDDRRNPELTALFLLSLDTLERRRVDTHCQNPVLPTFSPAGDTLAFVCVLSFDHTGIDLLHLASGRAETLLDSIGELNGLAWSSDGRSLYYSNAGLGGIRYLWRLEVASPQHRVRLPVGRDTVDIAVSPRGNRLAYVRSLPSTNIWRLPLPGPQAASGGAAETPQPWITSTREQNAPAISPDGTHIAFESNRSGVREVWVSDAEGNNLQQVTSFNSLTGSPRWSPDSRHLVLDSRAAGEANIYVWTVDGGPPRRVAATTRRNSIATWSADGQSLFYMVGEDGRQAAIYRVSAEGGPATHILDDGEQPVASPDGVHLFFLRRRPGLITIMRARLDGSELERIQDLPSPVMSAAYFPVGNVLYILSPVNGADEIDILDLTTRKRTPLYRLIKPAREWIGGLSVSSDQRWLLYTQVDDRNEDLYLVSGLKPPSR